MPPPRSSGALGHLAGRLRCPHCGERLTQIDSALRCSNGHSHDVARQGHVALLPRHGKPAPGDSTAMVAAREAFLGAGHYAPIAEALVAAAREGAAAVGEADACVVDLGAGTGSYLAALLDAMPAAWGLALDASRPALQRAVRAHPRIAGVACDAWQELPVGDGVADLIVNVFAPRNGREIARVLAPGGALVVVTPAPDHLRELVSGVGMLEVDADKQQRLHAALAPELQPTSRHGVEFEMTLQRDEVEALVAMGPSARHMDGTELRRRVGELPDPMRVTGAAIVETFGRA